MLRITRAIATITSPGARSAVAAADRAQEEVTQQDPTAPIPPASHEDGSPPTDATVPTPADAPTRRTRSATAAAYAESVPASGADQDAADSRIREAVELHLSQVAGALGKAVEKEPTLAARALKEALLVLDKDVTCAFVARFTATISRVIGGSVPAPEPLSDLDLQGFELVRFNPAAASAASVPKKSVKSEEGLRDQPAQHTPKASSSSKKHRRTEAGRMDEDPNEIGSSESEAEVGEDLAGADFDASGPDDDSEEDELASPKGPTAGATLAQRTRSSARTKKPSLRARLNEAVEASAGKVQAPQSSSALQLRLPHASDLRNTLKEGNIPPCWHKGLIILHDILIIAPLDPQHIADQVLSLLRPLQKLGTASASGHSKRSDLPGSIDRLEETSYLRKSSAIRSMIEHLHIFSIDRQARVHVKFGGPPDAIEQLDRTKLLLQIKPGGFLMQNVEDWRLGGRAIGPPPATSQRKSGSKSQLESPSASQSIPAAISTQGPLSIEERRKVTAINAYLKNPLRAGRLLHELGSIMGSVLFTPLLTLSQSMDDPVIKIRHLTTFEWHALTSLLRGARPQRQPSTPPFTAQDRQIIDAIAFGVRAVISRACAYALATADALADGNAGSYADVVVVRKARPTPLRGNEEPSVALRAPTPSPPPEASTAPDLQRVYGLEIPGSEGEIEIITRRPAFIADGWRDLLKNDAEVTVEQAFGTSGSNLYVDEPSRSPFDMADRRTLHLVQCDPQDVLPFASAYAAHFRLAPDCDAFQHLRDAIQDRVAVSYLLFVVLTIEAHRRLTATAHDPTFATKWSHPTGRILILIYFTSIFILIRCFYRVAELAEGYHGTLVTHEPYFLFLDSLPLLIGITPYIFFWPTELINETARRTREGYEARVAERDAEIMGAGPRAGRLDSLATASEQEKEKEAVETPLAEVKV
ncbi:hypothetical protein OC844_004544 [Tilletia horrida]|nr:hypothetical protein OC844_004544 [Tilletia horrida]